MMLAVVGLAAFWFYLSKTLILIQNPERAKMNFLEPLIDSYPPYIYKYIPFSKYDYIKNILSDNSLYFSLPSQFNENDAFDCRAYEIIINTEEDRKRWLQDVIDTNYSHLTYKQKNSLLWRNLYKHKNPDSPFWKKGMENLNRIFKNGFDETRTCILCVTGSEKNKEMWEQYIPDGQGVCIKLSRSIIENHLFSIPVSSSHISENMVWLRHVEYVEKPLQIPLEEFENADPHELGTTLLYTKLIDFKFEQEWRFIIHECINQSIKFPEDMVVEVILAPNVTDEQIRIVDEWNSQREHPFTVSRRS